ncbi:hypothetical protein [Rhodococcus rhodochrous]|uniref:Uncharacterized protein n=1 Tax=Rhodococcus rhodochrous TaxID=1829 RepID=A0AA46X1D6_RHORH|nr:hypothetical protein [Rhodococcus rhodochrous]UZF48313.1 hypothetical protein KUM34_028660 [Rhodococcus rhodochrous]
MDGFTTEFLDAVDGGDGGIAAEGAGGEDDVLGVQDPLGAVAVNTNGPPASGLVVVGSTRFAAGPDVDLQDPGVSLEPVGNKFLGGEDRPVVGVGEIRHLAVPLGVVERKVVVPQPPDVTEALGLLYNQRRDAER